MQKITMQKIVPSLWFDTQAEEAANYYCSIFPDSGILRVLHYGSAGPREAGMVLTVDFRLNGLEFNAINGGPEFQFSEATSLIVNCETQEQVDRLWDKLGGEGEFGVCGWVKDKFGFSWQIVPVQLTEMLLDPDEERAQRAMAAMLQMKKIDIAELQRAYDGG